MTVGLFKFNKIPIFIGVLSLLLLSQLILGINKAHAATVRARTGTTYPISIFGGDGVFNCGDNVAAQFQWLSQVNDMKTLSVTVKDTDTTVDVWVNVAVVICQRINWDDRRATNFGVLDTDPNVTFATYTLGSGIYLDWYNGKTPQSPDNRPAVGTIISSRRRFTVSARNCGATTGTFATLPSGKCTVQFTTASINDRTADRSWPDYECVRDPSDNFVYPSQIDAFNSCPTKPKPSLNISVSVIDTNTAPSGSITVSCSNGNVTINSASITDAQGGSMSITATSPSGALTSTNASGSGTISASVATSINYSSSNTFTSPRDGVSRTVTGKVTDPKGLSADISGTYICPKPPATVVSCSVSLSSSNALEPGDTITPTVSVTRNTDAYSPDLSVSASMTANGKSYNSIPSSLTLNTSNYVGTFTFQSITYSVVGSYSISATVTWAGGSKTCTNGSVVVARKPFFIISNGDLTVGGLYPSGTSASCTGTPTGKLFSWATVNPALDRKGANAELVAQVFGEVKEFYSAGGVTSPPLPKKWLTLANNNAGDDWGGNYGKAACMKDVYANTIDSKATLISSQYALQANDTGQKVSSSDLKITNQNIFSGKAAIYVTGNVYISNDIKLNTYSDINQAPFFALIVKGNIYIDPSVTQLDGMYVAQPNDGGVGGTIFTCGKNTNGVFSNYSANELYANCSNPLTFNGIVQAKSIKLHRTNGTLKDNAPAEIFKGRPSLYFITNPFSSTNTSTGSANVQFDSIKNLPPLL